MGFTILVIPKTAKTLKILLPIRLPIDILDCPLRIAMIEVTSSGKEVPNDTIVIPIINSDTPKDFAIMTALSTKSSEPK